ncbi:MAG: hypothetical protein R3E48_16760 [Burkholderiaceae bacterium]
MILQRQWRQFRGNIHRGSGPVSIARTSTFIRQAADSAWKCSASLTVTITNLLDGASSARCQHRRYLDRGVYIACHRHTHIVARLLLANYQQVLRSVTYDSISESPENTTARSDMASCWPMTERTTVRR